MRKVVSTRTHGACTACLGVKPKKEMKISFRRFHVCGECYDKPTYLRQAHWNAKNLVVVPKKTALAKEVSKSQKKFLKAVGKRLKDFV